MLLAANFTCKLPRFLTKRKNGKENTLLAYLGGQMNFPVLNRSYVDLLYQKNANKLFVDGRKRQMWYGVWSNVASKD